MARTKQATPLQRKPSDFSQGSNESPSDGWKQSNGDSQKPKSMARNGTVKAPSPEETPEQAGLTQLIICVAGIYASLYELPSITLPLTSH